LSHLARLSWGQAGAMQFLRTQHTRTSSPAGQEGLQKLRSVRAASALKLFVFTLQPQRTDLLDKVSTSKLSLHQGAWVPATKSKGASGFSVGLLCTRQGCYSPLRASASLASHRPGDECLPAQHVQEKILPCSSPTRDSVPLPTWCRGHSCSSPSCAHCQAQPGTAGTAHTPPRRRMVASQDSPPKTPTSSLGPLQAGDLCQHLRSKPTSPARKAPFLHSQALEKAAAEQRGIYSPKGTPKTEPRALSLCLTLFYSFLACFGGSFFQPKPLPASWGD